MEFELTGTGELELLDGTRHRVNYYAGSDQERPSGLYDSDGQIEPEDPNLLRTLMIDTRDGRFTLILADGSRLPILLTSSSGAIKVRGQAEPPAE